MRVTLRQEAHGGWEVWQPWQVRVACHTWQDVEKERQGSGDHLALPGPAWSHGLAYDTDLQPLDFALNIDKRGGWSWWLPVLSCVVTFCDS